MQELEIVKTEIDEFLYNQQALTVETSEDYLKAGDVYKLISNRIKKLEEKRKEYTQPLDESKKRIMADFKAISEPLEKFMEEVKVKMLVFAKAEQKRKDEEQAKLEQEALEKAKVEGVSEVQVAVVNEIKTQRSDFTTTTVKKIWKFEVVNEAEVPREFLMVDEKKIKQAISDGQRIIQGVRVFQDEQISIR